MEIGLGASPGIAIGKAYVYSNELNFLDGLIEIEEVDDEVERFNHEVAGAKEDIMLLISTINELNLIGADILKVHSQLIDDPIIKKMTIDKIKNNRMNCQTALKYTIRYLEETFSEMKTEYMQQRAADIKDIGSRITKRLLGLKDEKINDQVQCIVVAKNLMPTDILRFDKANILGFITEEGGTTSHVSIIARSLRIPSVSGVSNICTKAHTGDTLIVDGIDGKVFINPGEDIFDKYSKKREAFIQREDENKKFKDVPAVTKNGKRIVLGANIGGVEDIASALENGAEKIGLFRTEFVYMTKNELPSEDEQYRIYKAVIDGMKGKPVVIRTLDVGGDKIIPYLRIGNEGNPLSGARGIKYCLRNKGIFGAQVRAILRASGSNEIIILLPMISNINEVVEASAFIGQMKEELEVKGIPVGSNVKIGAMIEVPSAALIVKDLAEIVDYFSIGTNDLIQFVLGIGRTNKQENELYDPMYSEIIALIRKVVIDAGKMGKKVGICGEMAGKTEFTELLIDAGIDELSMNAFSITEVKKRIISY